MSKFNLLLIAIAILAISCKKENMSMLPAQNISKVAGDVRINAKSTLTTKNINKVAGDVRISAR